MNSVDDKSTNKEAFIYRAQYHWAILLGPILVMIIGGLALGSQGYHAMALIAFGFVWGICSYISLCRSEIGWTRSRVLIHVGFPMKRSYGIPLGEITVIDFYQPSLGSMLNFGKIIIVYQGKKKSTFRFVSCPAEFVRETHQQIVTLNPSSTGWRTSW